MFTFLGPKEEFPALSESCRFRWQRMKYNSRIKFIYLASAASLSACSASSLTKAIVTASSPACFTSFARSNFPFCPTNHYRPTDYLCQQNTIMTQGCRQQCKSLKELLALTNFARKINTHIIDLLSRVLLRPWWRLLMLSKLKKNGQHHKRAAIRRRQKEEGREKPGIQLVSPSIKHMPLDLDYRDF